VIQRRTREMTEPVLAPKVTGTLVLDYLLKKEEIQPDFVVLCSSTSALIGPFGEVGYTAANAFLDAYAYYRNSHHNSRTLSINWGAWKDVGMAVAAVKKKSTKEISDEQVEEQLKDAVSPAQGIEILTRAINSGFPHLAISTNDLNAVLEQRHASTIREKPARENESRPVHPRPELGTTYAAPRNEQEKILAKILKNFLGMDKVGIHDNFFELGLTSMDIVQISGQLKTEPTIQKDIPIATMFTYPTIGALAVYLKEEENNTPDLSTAKENDDVHLLENTAKEKHKLRQRKKKIENKNHA
jgi:acyl carrier protein